MSIERKREMPSVPGDDDDDEVSKEKRAITGAAAGVRVAHAAAAATVLSLPHEAHPHTQISYTRHKCT